MEQTPGCVQSRGQKELVRNLIYWCSCIHDNAQKALGMSTTGLEKVTQSSPGAQTQFSV